MLKKTFFSNLLLMLCAVSSYSLYSCNKESKTTHTVCFTPGNNCLILIEKAIEQAKEAILVQAYYFTSIPISEALISAHKRGIKVAILVDKSQLTAKGPLKKMLRNGIEIFVDVVPGIAHNKVMIIDDDQVITGSYNWTHPAEHYNAENVILICDSAINKAYKENWINRKSSSRKAKKADFARKSATNH